MATILLIHVNHIKMLEGFGARSLIAHYSESNPVCLKERIRIRFGYLKVLKDLHFNYITPKMEKHRDYFIWRSLYPI